MVLSFDIMTHDADSPVAVSMLHGHPMLILPLQLHRSLRQLESLRLQRLRVDIKDFQPAGVDGLNGGQAPWVATGKHLCGAATDFTLRCVASSMHATGSHLHQAKTTEPQTAQPSAVDGAQSPAIIAVDTDQSSEYISDLPNAPCHGSIAMKLDRDRTDACSSDSAQFGSDVAEDAKSCCSRGAHTGDGAGVQGFAVATCCHHRCSWQHYVGKPLFQQLGFSPDEFEIISWMTGMSLVLLATLLLPRMSDIQSLIWHLQQWPCDMAL